MLAHKKSCGQDHGCWGMHLHPTAAVALSSSLTVTAAVGVLVIAFANLWLPACVSCCPPVGGPGDTDTCAATRSSDFFYVLLSSIVIWTVGGEIGHVWGSCGCGTNILLWICRIRSTFVPVGHTTRPSRALLRLVIRITVVYCTHRIKVISYDFSDTARSPNCSAGIY